MNEMRRPRRLYDLLTVTLLLGGAAGEGVHPDPESKVGDPRSISELSSAPGEVWLGQPDVSDHTAGVPRGSSSAVILRPHSQNAKGPQRCLGSHCRAGEKKETGYTSSQELCFYVSYAGVSSKISLEESIPLLKK